MIVQSLDQKPHQVDHHPRRASACASRFASAWMSAFRRSKFWMVRDGGIGEFAAGAERKRQRSETDAEQDWVAHAGSLETALYNAAVLSLFTASVMNFV